MMMIAMLPVLFVLNCPIVAGEGSAKEVWVTIYRLGSPDFDVREAATRHLATEGHDAILPLLLTWLGNHDAERRFRIERLIIGFARNEDSHTARAADTALKLINPNALRSVQAERALAWLHNVDARVVSRSLTTGESPDELDPIKDVQQIELGKVTFNSLHLSHLSVFSGLVTLRLDDTSLVPESFSELNELQSLKTLMLVDVDLTPDHVEAIRSLKSLDNLILKNIELSTGHFRAMSDWEHLRGIALIDCRIKGDGLGIIGSMRGLVTVRMHAVELTGQHLKEFNKLLHLRHLYLVETNVSALDIDAFQRASPKCKVVKSN